MVRPVWSSPLPSEAEISETLQSDVMRFMAILALCLVAIFALVPSLPLRPVEPASALQPTSASGHQNVVTSQPTTPAPAAVSMPAPLREHQVVRAAQREPRPVATAAEPQRLVAQMPHPSPAPAPAPQPHPNTPATGVTSVRQEQLVLRFASDTALLALVAQRRVRVFAWVRDTAWRLSSEGSVLSFAPATAPKRFHNMAPDTVPNVIVHALNSATSTVGSGTVSWGVTLPADTTRELKRLVSRHRSGALVIQANGRVHLLRTS